MEKRNYVKPLLNSEAFVPQVYAAACTHTESGVGGNYYFKCDAGNGVYGALYDENWNRLTSWNGSFHACDETHTSPTDGDYKLGYFDSDSNHNNGNELQVYIWEEKNGSGRVTNRHATTNLDRDSWTKNHS